MPGIVVGIDGSAHSRGVLEWAMREAGVRREPLTVFTVQPAVKNAWGGSLLFPGDEELRAKAWEAAREAAEKISARLGPAGPPSFTVRAAIGAPAALLIAASRDADLLVVGSRGAGGFVRLMMGSVSSQVAHHAVCPIVVVPDGRTAR